MKELKYQQKAVKELVEKTVDLLRLNGNRQQLIFKAPTGAGKTVMASEMLATLAEELQTRSDLPFQHVAYIWIAPNKLHEQSYFKMKNFFTETRLLRAVMYDELDHCDGVIKPGEILFVNWASINSDKNIMVRDGEQNRSLFNITDRTKENGTPIVVIIDEEHLFWSKTADKSKKVLERINAKVEIRISATPKTQSYNVVNVPRQVVVQEEMIKEGVILNPDVAKGYNSDEELNCHLIKKALEKRKQLADAYRSLGVNINPLLLIQLPNDTTETMSSEDETIAEQVRTYLRMTHGIDEDNGKLAVWLSNEKSNLPGLEKEDCLTEVLLFKQAIALGWDCPRAAILLIFRKLSSEEFTVQTVGRILRMPEQKFYTNPLLNKGYVYTNISKDQIQIVADDMDYLHKSMLQSVRRENLQNVALPSSYEVRLSADRNRLGPDFKRVLMKVFEDEWLMNVQLSLFSMFDFLEEEENGASPEVGEESKVAKNRHTAQARGIRLDVKNVNIDIPTDVFFQNDIGTVDVGEKFKYARTAGEVNRVYVDFCRSLLGSFERSHSTDVLANYLVEAIEDLFEIFETDAKKVILYHTNKPQFTNIITKALARYQKKLEERQHIARQRGFAQYTWEVPEDRLYKEETHRVVESVKDHALMPFIELYSVSNPEQRFVSFLESNSQYIDWWYKNGDEGKQHYSIPYTRSNGDKALFYVDFVIRAKNGQVFLFDTKTEGSDPEAPNKHNALIDYINSEENKHLQLKGGIIIEKNDNWYYSPFMIDDTTEITGWSAFYPVQYK